MTREQTQAEQPEVVTDAAQDAVVNEAAPETEATNEAVEGDVIVEDAAALAQELAAAQDEIAQLKDQMLRAAADVQNARRRAEQDVEKAHKFGLEKFANEMLPIVDNLERAIQSCGDDEATKAIREGVEMTLSMFVSGLAKFNVETIDPQGQPFDPALHQAMSMVDAPDAEPNTVVAVMQKGYTLHGRLIRPAMVMIAKA